jgi:hypothetical protein
VGLSSVEEEYHALMEGTKEVVWLYKLLSEINYFKPISTIMYCDNVSSIKMAKNLVFHARTKHIECHYHFEKR